ncbi:unnamed protein product [Sphagnum troendelagicum]
MAFEVARVHGIIRSNIREDRSPMASSSAQGSVVVVGGGSSAAAAAAAWPDLASSPLGSSSSPRSTETEDDEDDELLLAGLAQTMLNSQDESSSIIQQQRHRGVGGKTHCEARPTVSDIETHKAASGSPPSSWSSGSSSSGLHWQSSSTASSKGSSQVSSRVSSPPTTPSQAQQQSDAWDLLYAAAGEVIRLKTFQQKKSASVPPSRYHHQHVHSQPLQTHNSKEVPVKIGVVPGGMVARNPPPSRAASSLLSPPSSLPYLRNRNERTTMNGSTNEQSWNSSTRGDDRLKTGLGAGSGSQSRLYPVHQQQQGCGPGLQKCYHGHYQSERCNDYITPQWTGANRGGGSGMRAVFLGSGHESSGTGVFIPRRAGNGPELKRKPACSSVLLPSRIVQLLNLNVENIRSHPSMSSSMVNPASCPGKYFSRLFSFVCCEMEDVTSCACPSILQQTTTPELSLPSEWTY